MASSVSPTPPTTTAQPTKRTHDEAELSKTLVDSTEKETPKSTLESEPPAKVAATDSTKLTSGVSNNGDAKELSDTASKTNNESTDKVTSVITPPTASGDSTSQVDESKKQPDTSSSTPIATTATEPSDKLNAKSEDVSQDKNHTSSDTASANEGVSKSGEPVGDNEKSDNSKPITTEKMDTSEVEAMKKDTSPDSDKQNKETLSEQKEGVKAVDKTPSSKNEKTQDKSDVKPQQSESKKSTDQVTANKETPKTDKNDIKQTEATKSEQKTSTMISNETVKSHSSKSSKKEDSDKKTKAPSKTSSDSRTPSQVLEHMEKTFVRRRNFITNDIPTIPQLKEKYPDLFMGKQLLIEFQRITKIDIDQKIQEFCVRYATAVIEMARGKNGSERVLARWEQAKQENETLKQYWDMVTALCLLPLHFDEDFEDMVQEIGEDEEVVPQGKVVPVLVARGNIFRTDEFFLIAENTIVQEFEEFTIAFASLYSSYWVFNMVYPQTIESTYDYIQRCIVRQREPGNVPNVCKNFTKALQKWNKGKDGKA